MHLQDRSTQHNRVSYLNCSKEWAFLGFHRTSDIQFFCRWNISPSSLLFDRKMSTKKQGAPLLKHYERGRHVDFLVFHVTWWNRDWPAENWCGITWHDIRHKDLFWVWFFLYKSFWSRLTCPRCLSRVIVSNSWKRLRRFVTFSLSDLAYIFSIVRKELFTVLHADHAVDAVAYTESLKLLFHLSRI